MAVPVWPTDLPQKALRDGFSETRPDGRLRTQNETGPPTMRRRFSSASSTVTIALPPLTPNQMARLDRFWDEDTSGGSLSFMWPDQRYDLVPLTDENDVELTDENDVPLLLTAWQRVSFGESTVQWTTEASMGIYWKASFELTVLP